MSAGRSIARRCERSAQLASSLLLFFTGRLTMPSAVPSRTWLFLVLSSEPQGWTGIGMIGAGRGAAGDEALRHRIRRLRVF